MYVVTIYDGAEDSQGTLIHSPYVDDLKVSFEIDQVLEGIPDMNLTINKDNPAWNDIRPLRTLIKVENVKSGKVEFDGRILKPKESMNSEGFPSCQYICEGKLAYLNDSNQRYAVLQDTSVSDAFAFFIEKHNEQVEDHKKFKVGNVTVTNNTDNVYRYVGYGKTYAELKDNLIDRLGGYLVLREEEDGTYIDYLTEVGEQKNTPIELRSNLRDMRRDIDPTQVITRVIPLGAREESEEGESAVSQPRLTIESVNGGLDYLDDVELIDEFGYISGEITFDDVTTPEMLLLRGNQFINNQSASRVSYEVTPLDLSVIDTSFERFELGNRHPVINPIFNIDESLQIIEKRINSNNPQRDSLVFGVKYQTLTEYQVQNNKRSRKVEELENLTARQAERITNIRNELTSQAQNLQQQINVIDTSDIPELEQAIINLSDAIDTLIDAVDEIPVYDVATETEDGLMSSSDKAKLNELESYELATDEEDGLMSASDKLKLDMIDTSNLIDPVDIQDLLDRLETLEND